MWWRCSSADLRAVFDVVLGEFEVRLFEGGAERCQLVQHDALTGRGLADLRSSQPGDLEKLRLDPGDRHVGSCDGTRELLGLRRAHPDGMASGAREDLV